jgi:hypothetical protein
MKKSTKKPELPPVKPKPNVDHDPCICFGHGSWYEYKTDPISIATCRLCNGAGYLIRTHPHGTRCPDRFPGFCSSCECKCDDCRRDRERTPKWDEFEKRHENHPGKFVVWATDPVRTEYGGIFRIAILQPWKGAGLVWQFVSVESNGKVETMSESFARSRGAFYDRKPHECNEYESGDAVKDAVISAQEKMRWFLRR